MAAADVVKAAKAKGISFTESYVSTVRYNAKKSAASPAKRGPGRPRKAAPASGGHGIEAEIERIVERAVERLLRARLGALLS
jgi:hypothetical protein